MTQFYSDVAREDELTALPDCEVFHMDILDFAQAAPDTWMADVFGTIGLDGDFDSLAGWYYWYCTPGCLPDSDAMGPYATQQEAITAARDDH